jgi:hypothetical protein
MAGRPGITIVDVARACIALKQKSRRLGPTNVRLELGKGSMTTISRHLQRLAFRNLGGEVSIKSQKVRDFK